MALLPPGPYILEVVKVERRKKPSVGGWQVYSVQYRLLGYSFDQIWAWLPDAPASKFLWEDVIDSFNNMPSLMGRAFLFDVHLEKEPPILGVIKPRSWNRVGAPLAELIKESP